MKYFIRANFKEGRLLAGRNNKTKEAVVIRAGVKSVFGNHTATSAISSSGEMGFNEAEPPESKHTTLEEYEQMMNEDNYEIQIYRIRGVSDEDHAAMAKYFTDHLLGIPYPRKGRMILLASRMYNIIYDNFPNMPKLLRQTWCTILSFQAARAILKACLDRPDGKRKLQPSPKTVENLLAWGVLIPETDLWVYDDATSSESPVR